MNYHDDDIRDPELSALLRRSLPEAPEMWVTDALSIPQHRALRRFTRSEPWLLVLGPHLAALALFAGLALMLFVPSVRATIIGSVPQLHPHDPEFWTVAGFLTPLLLLFCDQAARGFPVFSGLRHPRGWIR